MNWVKCVVAHAVARSLGLAIIREGGRRRSNLEKGKEGAGFFGRGDKSLDALNTGGGN